MSGAAARPRSAPLLQRLRARTQLACCQSRTNASIAAGSASETADNDIPPAVQQLTGNLGMFARMGDAGGNVETYEYTEIDRAVSAGLSLSGGKWHRTADTVGLAGVVNAISKARQHYLAAGGLGILIGDGRLPHPGDEHILETYYELAATTALHLTFDYQWVGNPAYNRDRGPVSIFALRVHLEL